MSAWSAQNGIVLGEIAVEEKSNEITAIPKLLKMLELTGCIVTIDAMGTQKEIAKTIKKQRADYVLPVKGNHPGLLEDISFYLNNEKETCDFAQTIDKSHGRIETRSCYITTDIEWLEQKKEWEGLSSIGMIESRVEMLNTGITTQSVHYVLYSKADMTAQQVLESKRTHWSVENNLHWTLDVNFGEDSMRMRTGFAAENMNILRHLALNLIKTETSYKASVNLKRKKCILSFDYLDAGVK